MSEEPEPVWPLLLVVGVVMVATFGISMSVDWWGNTVLRSGLVTAFVLIILADIQIVRDHYRKKAAKIPKSDERLERIVVYASMYAFRVGIIFMIVLIFLHLLRGLDADVVVALSLSVFAMAGTFFIFYCYFDRKGDVKVI
ncbi:MAG: hypothetical protein HXS54_18345 [Theionarchaea archaeon]|nr:hypothetical protein [Theionarchaea archaeon]